MEMTFIIAATILICVIGSRIAISLEEKSFNKCKCIKCETELECFDMDSQGGRGYKCPRCGHTVWVSYHIVDKKFRTDYDVKKKVKPEGILERIYDKNSIVVFDIDGVLAKYEFGENNHNYCSEEEWNKFAFHYSKQIYDKSKPVHTFQTLVWSKGASNVYACAVADEFADEAKKSFVRRFYAIPEENIFFVKSKEHKLELLHDIKLHNQNLDDEEIILIDDNVSTLTYVQERSNYSTCHVSSFLE